MNVNVTTAFFDLSKVFEGESSKLQPPLQAWEERKDKLEDFKAAQTGTRNQTLLELTNLAQFTCLLCEITPDLPQLHRMREMRWEARQVGASPLVFHPGLETVSCQSPEL